ncbi:carboxylesterase/lipase family protein [uncultured Methanoregula sp.]|uniref:carboxylesterase/lipase family protein n=1 Tax=uncultured Methanoregula sp. TaxID=1005933 RepID=UPI002AAC49B8|nr:carboxylesterase/lipase family protein [uncultured Methanoregula sp.]
MIRGGKRVIVPAGLLVIIMILAGLVLCAGCNQKSQDAWIVKTDAGPVLGATENGIAVFRGIPYAAPPTGDLRWKPPATVQPWSSVRNATVYGAICPQVISDDPTPGAAPPAMREDCLFLNVWTPAKSPDEKLPVMVFIHGGAFMEGAGSLPLYDGSALAKKGVIVVTLNYRLGVLGFLSHPDLANESATNTSGNYGLEDQQAALQWVQKNIGAFGGNPSRVTVFGESAGATSILAQLSSPQAKGLFRQAIIESGPLWTNGSTLDIISTRNESEQNGEEYARSLGYTGPGAIRQMRIVDAMTLVNATPHPASPFWLTHTMKFKPSVDGGILPAQPEDQFNRGQQNRVPLIIGTNADEGTMLAAQTGMNVSGYERYIHKRFGSYADKVLTEYPAKTPDDVQYQMERIMTDFDFTEAAKFVAGSNANLNESTYLYRFTYGMPGQPFGAFHGSELYFVFRPASMNPDPVSGKVSDMMMEYWTRFAKTGSPNDGMNVTWPQYSRENPTYLEIGKNPRVRSGY